MTGKVTVQWCPGCKAWSKSKCISIDVLAASAELAEHGSVPYNYRREEQRCATCDGSFVNTSLHDCEAPHRWMLQGEIGNLRGLFDSNFIAAPRPA